MKKPDEIKKGLEICVRAPFNSCDGCAYDANNCPKCVESLVCDALALIQQLEARVPRWISVEERMPKRYEHVLVATRFTDEGEQDVEVAYLAIDRWRKPDGPLYGKVTHWMPLPEPPKE